MDERLKYLLTVLAFTVGFIFFSKMQEMEYQEAMQEKDQELELYRTTLIPLYDQIDSTQALRNENDTATYDLTADSLERLFTKRFGDHLQTSGERDPP